MRGSSRAFLSAALAVACGSPEDTGPNDTGSGAEAPTPVTIAGRVAKGPFVLGSTVQLYTADDQGVPTGLVFAVQTSDDLGAFEVTVLEAPHARLWAQGFYYNEMTGALSQAPIMLRGHLAMGVDATQTANLNLLTHLGASRVEVLLGQGMSLVEAIATSDAEVRAALGIGGPPPSDGVQGTDVSVIGADDAQSAWLLATSAVFAQAAVLRGDAVDANLTALVNATQADLADDGQIEPERRAELDAAESVLDADAVQARFEAYLASLGSDVVVPDIHAGLDSDQDGVPNGSDLCRYLPDPGQEDVDHDGFGDACDYQFRRLGLGFGLLDDGRVLSFSPDAVPRATSRFEPPGAYWTADPVSDFDGGCVITTEGDLLCWGSDGPVVDDFVSLRAGDRQQDGVCALRADGTVACFDQGFGSPLPVPEASYSEVDVLSASQFDTALDVACGIRADSGLVECWGVRSGLPYVEEGLPTEPVRSLDLAFADYKDAAPRGCAVRVSDSSLACWGSFVDDVPSGTDFVDVRIGPGVACASRVAAGPVCWHVTGVYGTPHVLERTPPSTVLHQVVPDLDAACGLDEDRLVHCW